MYLQLFILPVLPKCVQTIGLGLYVATRIVASCGNFKHGWGGGLILKGSTVAIDSVRQAQLSIASPLLPCGLWSVVGS
jgi:hypothetical protein